MKHINELQSVLSEQQYSELAKLILEAVEEAYFDGYNACKLDFENGEYNENSL